jgi:hypothetical protein
VAKNMCSVRQRPMPWAPLVMATLASSGVSVEGGAIKEEAEAGVGLVADIQRCLQRLVSRQV